MDWSTIFISLLSSAGVGTSIVVFGGKALVNRWIDRGKLRLQSRLNEQLESHKAELVRTTNELQERLRIEYGSLYNERLTAIKEIYEYLFRIEHQLYGFSFDPDIISSQEELNYVTNFMFKISSIITNLDNKIRLTLIYFSEDDAKELFDIMEPLNTLVDQWHKWQQQEDAIYDTAPLLESIKSCQEKPIRPLITTIQNKFRKLIGVK